MERRCPDTQGVDRIVYFCTPSRLSFSFSSGPRAWRSPYCDSVIVVRFWKIAHCESIFKTGSLTKSSPVASYEYLRHIAFLRSAARTDRDRSVLIFIATYITLSLSLFLFGLFLFIYSVFHHPPFIKGFLDQFEVVLPQQRY